MEESVRGASALLVEREAELERLGALVTAAASGEGAAIVLQGPAGIGKSTLLDAARDRGAEQGLRCLSAAGGELERDFAYGVVRQLFDPLVVGGPDSEGLLDGPAAAAAPLLGIATEAGAAVLPGADPAGAAMHGLYWLVANLAARGPILLAVDDLHWVDTASLRFVAYLARRVGGLPILLVTATRPAVEAQAPELLDRLMSDPSVERLDPDPLSQAAVRQLLGEELAGEAGDELGRACHRATGGNPLFVRAVARAIEAAEGEPDADSLPEAGSAAIAHAVSLRLSSLGEDTSELARAVAVLGASAELRHAAALAQLSARVAGEAADALTAAGVIAGIRPLEFVHPIVRSAVYREIPPADRAARHLAAARLLDAEGNEAEGIAPHLLATEPRGDPWVVDVLRRAAARSTERGAPEAAMRSLRRALQEPPSRDLRPQLLAELGAAELAAGPADDAIEHLTAALRETDDPRGRARVALDLAAAQSASGRWFDAVATLEPATEALRDVDAELARQLEAHLIQAAGFDVRTHPIWLAHLDLFSKDMPNDTASDRLLLGALATGRLLRGGSAAEAVGAAGQALDGGIIAEQSADSTFVLNTCIALTMGGAFERCESALEEAFADARARGSLTGFARVSLAAALLRLQQGALSEAASHAGDALAVARERGHLLARLAQGVLVEAQIEQGALDSAAADLPLEGEISDTFMHNWLLYARGRLRLARGEIEPAVADLEELGRREKNSRGRNPAIFPYRSQLARARHGKGEIEQARALGHEELELARSWGAPGPLARALRGLAAVEEPAPALELLRESLAVVEGSGCRLEHAKTLVELGSAQRRSNARAASREPLYEGMELAHACGAAPVVERARQELVATGARPRRAIRTGVDALTPSERRVARMAAEGMANREIASALFVATRTVEVHLTHAYQKLDISSREQLGAALSG